MQRSIKYLEQAKSKLEKKYEKLIIEPSMEWADDLQLLKTKQLGLLCSFDSPSKKKILQKEIENEEYRILVAKNKYMKAIDNIQINDKKSIEVMKDINAIDTAIWCIKEMLKDSDQRLYS